MILKNLICALPFWLGTPTFPDYVSVVVYPNPFTGDFIVQFDVPFDGKIEVYNIIGEKLQEIESTGLMVKITSMNNVPDGIYFLKVKIGNEYFVKKVIKNNP